MEFAGITPVDHPDPRLEAAERAKALPVPLYGFAVQPGIEDWDALSVATGESGAGVDEVSVSLSYTLWRHPDSPEDPRNLAELDESTREAIETEPPWPRPAWILEHLDRMRRPMLWEAVRTSWRREPAPWFELDHVLAEHCNHILRNRFRRELGIADDYRAAAPEISARAVEPDVPVEVDGAELPGVRLDTDPFVVGLGVELPSGGILTAVVPRDEQSYLRLAFARRAR